MRFENDVKTYGTQAFVKKVQNGVWFENDVKTYGTQAIRNAFNRVRVFENDVKTYGTQASKYFPLCHACLRMM